jgi:outer membrane lipoprotein LolB
MTYRILVIAFISFLSACAHKTPTSVEYKTHQESLRVINRWQLNGKLGIKAPEESGSASIKWQQKVDAYNIQLAGPLGQKSIHIEGDNHQVVLTEKGKPPVKANSAEDLIKETTGWKLPLTQLNYWIRGLAAPDTKIKNVKENDRGLIGTLEQSGWTIQYASYHQVSYRDQTFYLPQKITAHYQDFRLTLIVRKWTFQEDANP